MSPARLLSASFAAHRPAESAAMSAGYALLTLTRWTAGDDAHHSAHRGKRGRISVVLHKTELVALGIGHDDDYALVVVVSFVGGPSSQADNELDSLVEVVDGHVKMDADLPAFGSGTGWKTSRGWGSPRWPR